MQNILVGKQVGNTTQEVKPKGSIMQQWFSIIALQCIFFYAECNIYSVFTTNPEIIKKKFFTCEEFLINQKQGLTNKVLKISSNVP